MKRVLGLAVLGAVLTLPAQAEEPLKVVYPPADHQTTSDKIFLIGTAPPQGPVTVNGQVVANRSPAGHFAPSFPLKLGENTFTLRYQAQDLTIKVTRLPSEVAAPTTLGFAKDSLTPAVNITRLPGELLCFSAIATPNSTVSVKLANQTIPLTAQSQSVELPPNAAALTQTNQPTTNSAAGRYQGCATAVNSGSLGQPEFTVSKNGASVRQVAPGRIEVVPIQRQGLSQPAAVLSPTQLPNAQDATKGPPPEAIFAPDQRSFQSSTSLAPAQLSIAEVTSNQGVARTGPSTDFSRLTPLPKGTKAVVTGREGDWLRLDYGGWINSKETRLQASSIPPYSRIRSVRSQQVLGWTEVIFPLQMPVPVSVNQGDRTFTLTLYNTTAQTDTIFVDNDPLISRLDWQQVAPDRVQYTFNLKTAQQWGYKLNYNGTSLVLSLRHPPGAASARRDASVQPGVTVLLDPGHGSENDLGSRGPTGYPEKDVALTISKLVRQELQERGIPVVMTREGDEDLYPQDRVDKIEAVQPTIALSLHYNALPDNGDALNTQGIGAFWYHPQSHSLAAFLHDYLVEKLNRPSYGVFWNNLALTRPTVAPAVLMELGFMINPTEFEWITNPQAQQQLAAAIAEGVVEWLKLSQGTGSQT